MADRDPRRQMERWGRWMGGHGTRGGTCTCDVWDVVVHRTIVANAFVSVAYLPCRRRELWIPWSSTELSHLTCPTHANHDCSPHSSTTIRSTVRKQSERAKRSRDTFFLHRLVLILYAVLSLKYPIDHLFHSCLFIRGNRTSTLQRTSTHFRSLRMVAWGIARQG